MSDPARLVTLRPIREDDLPFLRRLYGSTREEELVSVGWSREQIEAFVDQQFEAQHAQYMVNYPGADFLVIEVGGRPVGRLYLHRRTDEHRLVDLSLLPEHRAHGIGAQILAPVVVEADRAGKPVRRHVEKMNPALRFWERHGFRPIEDRGVYWFMERPVGAVSR